MQPWEREQGREPKNSQRAQARSERNLQELVFFKLSLLFTVKTDAMRQIKDKAVVSDLIDLKDAIPYSERVIFNNDGIREARIEVFDSERRTRRIGVVVEPFDEAAHIFEELIGPDTICLFLTLEQPQTRESHLVSIAEVSQRGVHIFSLLPEILIRNGVIVGQINEHRQFFFPEAYDRHPFLLLDERVFGSVFATNGIEASIKRRPKVSREGAVQEDGFVNERTVAYTV